MRLCNKCGAQVSDRAVYCEMCGKKLIETSNEPDISAKGKSNEPSPGTKSEDKPDSQTDIEELDLTELDKKLSIDSPKPDEIHIDINTASEDKGNKESPNGSGEEKKDSNIIDLKEVLESEEKVEMNDDIKREVLADEEEFYKVCPMCGEEITINKKLLEDTPVVIKCLKCGQETKIW